MLQHPIVRLPSGQLGVVRSSDWSLSGQGLTLLSSEEDAREIGFPIKISPPIEVSPGQLVAVIGEELYANIHEIGSPQLRAVLETWVEVQDGFAIKCLSLSEYDRFAKDACNEAIKVFDAEFQKFSGRVVSGIATAALAVLSGTSRGSREQQFIRALAAAKAQEDVEAHRSMKESASIRLQVPQETLDDWVRDYEKLKGIKPQVAPDLSLTASALLAQVEGAKAMLARALDKERANEELAKTLSGIAKAADLSRVLMERLSPEPEKLVWFNLNRLFADIDEPLRRAASPDLKVFLALDPQLAMVKGSPEKLAQAIERLVAATSSSAKPGEKLFIKASNVNKSPVGLAEARKSVALIVLGGKLERRPKRTGFFRRLFSSERQDVVYGLDMARHEFEEAGGAFRSQDASGGIEVEVLLPAADDTRG